MGEHAAPVQAVQAPGPQLPAQNAFHLQRKCACGSYGTGGGECDKCRKDGTKLQRTAASCGTPNELPSIVYDVLGSSGQPLDTHTRAWLEPRFGHDFSSVRVHTDARAAESAQAVNALAYTVGRDVVFGAGQYAPRTERGGRLLAHELTHVVQQSRGGATTQAKAISEPGDAAELEADATATRVLSGEAVQVTQTPSATLHALSEDEGKLVGGIVGGVVGTGLLTLGILWLSGVFDKEKFSDTELTAYLTLLATTRRIEDHRDSDNKARDVVRHWQQPDANFNIDNGFRANGGSLTGVELKRLLILEMLSGVTAGADEESILTILGNSQPADILEILDPTKGLSIQKIDNSVGGGNHDRFEQILAEKFPRGGPRAAPQLRQTGRTCTTRQALMVDYARKRAIDVVDTAISTLATRAGDSDVVGAINCWFPGANRTQVNDIRGVFERTRAALPRRIYHCGGEGGEAELAGITVTAGGESRTIDCLSEYAVTFGRNAGTAQATTINEVFLCAQFFRQDAVGQVITVIHESVHAAGILTDPRYNPPCGLELSVALANPDSYAYLANNLMQLSTRRRATQSQQSGQESQVQRKASDNETPAEVPDEVDEVLQSSGESLDATTRAWIEPRFGRDFSGVRIHADAAAAESARAVNAHAYTVGEDVVFGAGQYEPGTKKGAALIAHELTHVAQQENHAVTATQTAKPVSEPSDLAEVEADSVAAEVLSGHAVQVSQAPSAAVHAQSKAEEGLTGGEQAGIVLGVIGGLGLIGVGIAALLGAFEKSKFDKCTDDQQKKALAAMNTARGWLDIAVPRVNEVIANPKKADDRFKNLLSDHFKITPDDKEPLSRIGEVLGAIQSNFNSALYECIKCSETEKDKGAGRTSSLLGPYLPFGRIGLCNNLFEAGAEEFLADTIVHELVHRYGGIAQIDPEVYRISRRATYNKLPTDMALRNADSYAMFVKDLAKGGGSAAEAETEKPASEGGEAKRKAITSGEPPTVPPIVHEVLHSPGQPLDQQTRDWAESRFDRDFSEVTVHTGVQAEDSAQKVNAAAYTVGNDLVFGRGRYEPETTTGRELLGHELTHVVQQESTSSASGPLEIGSDSGSEQEADRVGHQVAHGDAISPAIGSDGPGVSRKQLQRQPEPEKPSTPVPQPAPDTQSAPETQTGPETQPTPETKPEPAPQPEQLGGIPEVSTTRGMAGYPPHPKNRECFDVLWAREYQRIFRLDTVSVIGVSAKPASEKKDDVSAAQSKNDDLAIALVKVCRDFAMVKHPFMVHVYFLDADPRNAVGEPIKADYAQANRELGQTLKAGQDPGIRIFVERNKEYDEKFTDGKTLDADLKKLIESESRSAVRRGAGTGLKVGYVLGGLTALGVGFGVGSAVSDAGGSLGAAFGWGALAGALAGGVMMGLSAAFGALIGAIWGTDRGTKELSKERIKQVQAFVALLRKTGEVKGKELTSDDADDLARDAVTLWIDDPTTLPLTVKDRRLLILAMVDGPTMDDDERAIIKLLENSTDAEVLEILDPNVNKKQRVTIELLDSEIHGAEWDETKQMLEARFPTLGAPEVQRTETAREPKCDAPQAMALVQAQRRANEMVPITIQRLTEWLADPEKQKAVLAQVQCYFPGAARADVETIKGLFEKIQAKISSVRYVCLSKKPFMMVKPDCAGELDCSSGRTSRDVAQTVPCKITKDGNVTFVDNPETYICPTFFENGPIYQATTLVHEWVHHVVPETDIDDYDPKCGGMKLDRALLNPDSFALLARDLSEGKVGPAAAAALPTVKLTNFRNTGAPTPENRCVSCLNIPTLGLDPGSGVNFMEIRGDISGHRPGALYDFKRTKEVAIWMRIKGAWKQMPSAPYEPPGTLDDASADDEDAVPKNDRIYTIDGPGLHQPMPMEAPPEVEGGVYKGNFVESVNVKVDSGPWTPSSDTFKWHSLFTFERGKDGFVRRTPKDNEIEPGHVTIGSGPPGP